jgi:hypothetical protein
VLTGEQVRLLMEEVLVWQAEQVNRQAGVSELKEMVVAQARRQALARVAKQELEVGSGMDRNTHSRSYHQ